jgi:hypothetical protein
MKVVPYSEKLNTRHMLIFAKPRNMAYTYKVKMTFRLWNSAGGIVIVARLEPFSCKLIGLYNKLNNPLPASDFRKAKFSLIHST